MKIHTLLFLVVFCAASSVSYAGTDIGFGYVKGYKIGNADADTITIFLKEGFDRDNGVCNGVATIKYSDFTGSRSEKRIDQMLSTILAAYMSEKKIRLHSHKNNCDVTFVALQETLF